MRRFLVSFPDRGGCMSARIHVSDDEKVLETHTAFPQYRGYTWGEVVRALEDEHGDDLKIWEL